MSSEKSNDNNDNTSTNNSNSDSSNNSTSSIFTTHLQPSAPPPSITKNHLNLFKIVSQRRKEQLLSLSLHIHKQLYLSLTKETKTIDSSGAISTELVPPITAEEISTLFQKLPNKKPTANTHHYTSLVLYLLTENFYSSDDLTKTTEQRKNCLLKLKYICSQIDIAFSDHLKKEKKEKDKLLLEKANQEKQKIFQLQQRKEELRQQQQQQQLQQQQLQQQQLQQQQVQQQQVQQQQEQQQQVQHQQVQQQQEQHQQEQNQQVQQKKQVQQQQVEEKEE